MANEQNLEGFGFDERTPSEQRKIAISGGKASGRARREKANLRKIAAGLIQGDEMQMMILALMRSATDENNKNQVAAFKELERLLDQDKTAAEIREQNARIEKIKAETETIRRVEEKDDDGVEVIFRGEKTSDS